MDKATIRVEHAGHARIITLERPERRNAISLAMMAEICDAVSSAERDATVGALIITGGPSYFSAGADLTEAQSVSTPAEVRGYLANLHRLTETLETSAKPVVAAIEGFCLTGGLELALACDIRIGAEASSYGITSARIGTVAGAGGTQRLPRLVGPGNALEILFGAEPIDATHAFRIGLINRLVPKGAALVEALRLATLYAARAPLSHAFVKRAVYRGLDMDLASGLELEMSIVAGIYGTEDKAEGIAAFLEKRQPIFKGR